MNKPLEHRILGLDIGARSVGWAIIDQTADGDQLVAAGARVFPLGVDENDQYRSRNVKRREARLRRRLLARRRMRLHAVRTLLQRNGFLPENPPDPSDASWQAVLGLNPYDCRAKALRSRLDPYEFGRAIFHIAHRRGFKSNRRESSEDEERGVVKAEIRRLDEDMRRAGAETLGEYLASLNPHEQRLRGRYTSRDWYRHEFDLIIERQQNLGLHLPETFVHALRRAIFFQRKVWWDPASIGRCPFEPRRLRIRASHPLYQRFRLLQAANHLAVRSFGGVSQKLTEEQRKTVIELLERNEKVSFAELRKALSLKRGFTFNLEEGGEKEIKGNVTACRIRSAIGAKWDEAPEPIRAAIYEAVASIEDEDLLKDLALKKPWGLTPDEAEKLSEITLEDDHGALSSKAIRRLLPHLEHGLSYAEAVQRVYPNQGTEPQVDRLPPVEDLRNPTAQRAMTEMRRVVNAILQKYGLPGKIRLELARDLKKPKAARVEMWEAMRKRAAEREKAREQIINKAGISNPSPADIEKALLFEECGGICPYTGNGISFRDLFGPHPLVEVEHIIPWSRSLDNSFANKTLCRRDANREKRDKTPFEAFSGDKERYEAILSRVKKFKSPYAMEKLRRFQCENPEGPETGLLVWTGADLHATSLAARRAAEYLGRLYPPEERKSRIQVSAGRTTAQLRSAWNLNRILGIADEKNREDHRHHAIDAIVVALTTPALTRELTLAASRAQRPGTYTGMALPPALYQQIEHHIRTMLVSHRVDRRVQGSLHNESHYGIIRKNGKTLVVIRKALTDLSEDDIDKIVDDRIRELVRAAAAGGNPRKVFADPARRPVLPTKSGRAIPIRRVRIESGKIAADNLIRLEPARNVAGGGNHHAEIFETRDKRGQPSWRVVVVSRFEAMRRKRFGEPIIRRVDESGNPLVCSLCIGDTVLMRHDGAEKFYVVQRLSERDYNFREVSDGRPATKIHDPIRIRSADKLRQFGLTKLSVDPLGEYRRAHD
ncbi:MAG: type II CRISPR RNA-guided endonuclease Cas9 [Kiritimatiellae bacterium]|nr:type II CRISPR RNA-guided endonuclease Cas9 [Kiritimatiellia bacterium]MDW8458911.1 type II CRISPR RNA-guided endonuclease Cas9 [Verrucomicrobiota bacterium]